MACRLVGAKPYLKQCWDIVNWILGNKLQWNLNWNLNIFIEENAFEIVVWKWRPFCLGLNVLNYVRERSGGKQTIFSLLLADSPFHSDNLLLNVIT